MSMATSDKTGYGDEAMREDVLLKLTQAFLQSAKYAGPKAAEMPQAIAGSFAFQDVASRQKTVHTVLTIAGFNAAAVGDGLELLKKVREMDGGTVNYAKPQPVSTGIMALTNRLKTLSP